MSMTSLRSESIQTQNLRHQVLVQGDEDGLPVLLLHGSYGSSRWWLPLLELLPDALRIAAPDLRGCGRSDKPDDGYDIVQQADDIWQLVTVLGWREFDLVGHSTGGAIATEFALRHGEVLHSLSLVNSVPLEGVHSPVETLRLLAQMRDDRTLLAEALSLLMPAFFPLESDDEENGPKRAFFNSLVEDAAGMAPAAFTEVAQAVSTWNRFDDANRLTLPTQLIWGELDQIVEREAMTRSLIAIPGANNLEVIRGVGHSPMIEAPLALAELLIDFITDDFAGYEEIRGSADDQRTTAPWTMTTGTRIAHSRRPQREPAGPSQAQAAKIALRHHDHLLALWPNRHVVHVHARQLADALHVALRRSRQFIPRTGTPPSSSASQATPHRPAPP